MNARKLLLIAALMSLGCPSALMGQEKGTEKLGTVQFPVSCSPAAQQEFNRAVALLHSFWFDAAVQAFPAVTRADPGCGMGYLGEALAILIRSQPVWRYAHAQGAGGGLPRGGTGEGHGGQDPA